MGIFKKAERAVSKLIPHQHSKDTRAANSLAKSQMEYYQSAKEEIHAQNESIAKEREMENTKIHEKQIRAMRNKFRNPGFLGSGDSETSATLG